MLCKSIEPEQLKNYHLKGYVGQRKIDGIRCLAMCDVNGVRLFGRNGKRLNENFPEIVEALSKFKSDIFDGEIVCDTFNHTLSRCQMENKLKAKLLKEQYPAKYYIFDELIACKTLVERYKRLMERDFGVDGVLSLLPMDLDIISLWEKAKKENWEGIIVKKLDSLYEKGFCKVRTNNWLKCKYIKSKDLEVVRYEMNTAGIRVETESGLAIQISGSQHLPVKKELDEKGKCLIEVNYLEENNGVLRQPTFKEKK